MSESEMKFYIEFFDEDIDEAMAAVAELEARDVQQVRQRGTLGLEWLIIGLVAPAVLANLAIRLSRLWKCGVVVDTRGSTVITKKNCDFPAGTVVIVSGEREKIEFHTPTDMDIPNISNLLKK
jgi:hypothetical protein